MIGGGIFGAMSATRLADAGHATTLFERLPALLHGTSRAANRVHIGLHYPRDRATAEQCLRGFARFQREFAEAIIPGVKNAYFVAAEGSLTSAEDFVSFCDGLGLAYREIDRRRFRPLVENVAIGVLSEEIMVDPAVVRRLALERLGRAGVTVRLGSAVTDIVRHGSDGFDVVTREGTEHFDAVVNCTYANANRLAAHLGHAPPVRQYEYVVMPILRFDDMAPASVTVMDGPFCCLLPSGGADHLLNHVAHSVVARQDGALLDPTWLDPATAPFARLDAGRFADDLLAACAIHLPEVRRARIAGFTQGARVVLANAEDTDARPSIIVLREPGFVDVFSGKIDHSIWVGDEVVDLLSPAAGRRSIA